MFIFQHSYHTSFSKVLLSDIEKLLHSSGPIKKNDFPACTVHSSHDYLQSFFLDNFYLLRYYRDQVVCGCKEEIKEDLELLARLVEKKESSLGTVFSCPPGPACNWLEDDWTLRLAKGIRRAFPECDVSFSALTKRFSDLSILDITEAPQCCYLFRGAPDIIGEVE